MASNRKALYAAAALVAVGAWTQDAQATVVFSDDFTSYSSSTIYNWPGNSTWAAPGPGTVDLLIASSGFGYLCGGFGACVDLDGSNGLPGTLETVEAFSAGTYTLSFELEGNDRGDISKTTDISLGDWSTSITLPSSAAFGLYTFTFSTTGGDLVFSDLPGGNQNIGNLLTDVTLSTPEPGTLALLGAGLMGLAGFVAMRRRKTTAVE